MSRSTQSRSRRFLDQVSRLPLLSSLVVSCILVASATTYRDQLFHFTKPLKLTCVHLRSKILRIDFGMFRVYVNVLKGCPFVQQGLASLLNDAKPEEFPAEIMKFPQSLPTIFWIPIFHFENSQNGFYCIFINKYFFSWPPELKNFSNLW